MRRGVALKRWAEPENDFLDSAAAGVSLRLINTVKQARNREILRTNAAEWIQPPSENVIHTPMQAGRFDAHEIPWLFHDEYA